MFSNISMVWWSRVMQITSEDGQLHVVHWQATKNEVIWFDFGEKKKVFYIYVNLTFRNISMLWCSSVMQSTSKDGHSYVGH